MCILDILIFAHVKGGQEVEYCKIQCVLKNNSNHTL